MLHTTAKIFKPHVSSPESKDRSGNSSCCSETRPSAGNKVIPGTPLNQNYKREIECKSLNVSVPETVQDVTENLPDSAVNEISIPQSVQHGRIQGIVTNLYTNQLTILFMFVQNPKPERDTGRCFPDMGTERKLDWSYLKGSVVRCVKVWSFGRKKEESLEIDIKGSQAELNCQKAAGLTVYRQ